jgi:hypothetical protein
MNLPEASSFEQPPAGAHTAICYAFIDLGTQQNDYQGDVSFKHQIILRWELVGELMADGKPFSIGQFYTWSMNEKAKLRMHLESWRGTPFTKEDFGPKGRFDTKNLLGKPCTLLIGLNEKGNARVEGVGAKMKGVEVSDPANPLIYFSLAPDRFDAAILGNLSEKMQDMIKRSPEYAALHNEKPLEQFTAALDDEIPF